MTLPLRLLSASIIKPGVSNSKRNELTYCGCLGDGIVQQRFSIADPNISPSKLNISAEYLIDNSKSEAKIESVIFSLLEKIDVFGIKNFEGCCEGGKVPNFDEKEIESKKIQGVEKGGIISGIIDFKFPADPSFYNDFGNSIGLNVRRIYELRMFPLLSTVAVPDAQLSCALNAAQSIQGELKFENNAIMMNPMNPYPANQPLSNISQYNITSNQIQDPQQILVLPSSNRDSLKEK